MKLQVSFIAMKEASCPFCLLHLISFDLILQKSTATAAYNFYKRLQAREEEAGGHFEHFTYDRHSTAVYQRSQAF